MDTGQCRVGGQFLKLGKLIMEIHPCLKFLPKSYFWKMLQEFEEFEQRFSPHGASDAVLVYQRVGKIQFV